jgi:nucleoside phosphorylase
MNKCIVILTAVEREFHEIMECLPNYYSEETYGAHRYEIFQKIINNSQFKIAISMTGQGPSEAAAHAAHAILTYNPILIVFFGTCGAVKKDVNIGDIIIAERAYDFLRGKEGEVFFNKPISHEVNPKIHTICESICSKIHHGELLKDLFSDKKRSIYFQSIASSTVIVAGDNAKTKEIIKRNFADAYAVELEGYGFYTATYKNDVNGIIIRGVTDDTSFKEDHIDRIQQPKVMGITSKFVFEFIDYYVKNYPIKGQKKVSHDYNNSHDPEGVTKIVNFFPDDNKRKNLIRVLNSKKCIFCGFLSFDMETIKQKPHLGHCYFINLVDKLLKNRKVVLFVCTTYKNLRNMTKEKRQLYIKTINNTIEKWKCCFSGKVEIFDIKEYLQNNQVHDPKFSQDFSEYFIRTKNKFPKINTTDFEDMLMALDEWRKTGKLDDDYYIKIQEYLEILRSGDKLINKQEIISMAYIIIKRPEWFTEEWLIDFLIFWKHRAPKLIDKNVMHSDLVLLESKRNSYVWDAISFCYKKIIGELIFTNKFSFNNVPNIHLEGYMKTSEAESALFLRDFDYDKINEINPKFFEAVSNMFQIDSIKESLTQKEKIESIVSYYKNRLKI